MCSFYQLGPTEDMKRLVKEKTKPNDSTIKPNRGTSVTYLLFSPVVEV
jgi:hypothetical protein